MTQAPVREFKLAKDQLTRWQLWIERAAQEAQDKVEPERDQMEIEFQRMGIHPR